MADRDQLLSSLRYQINSPRVTTMGYCAAGCGQLARGAGTCWQCLLAELEAQEAEAEAAWQRGELSPLKCLMYRYRLDEPALAQITGLFQWRIRRHFRPAIYRRLSAAILARYADAFGLPVEQLIGYQKDPA